MNIIKSIAALLAGLITTAALSSATDAILESTGVLPKGHIYVAAPVIILVLAYRTVFNVLGAYVVARLAPHHKTAHAVGLGIFGSLGSVIAGIATMNMHVGPLYYPLTLAALGIPAAYLGAKLATRESVAPVLASSPA
ncbi:hypothetical protein [Nocardia sp. NPDC058666]|uniref:hypothetical protein n=1 Tax=Nocardia sp. NPDC058666 TaxID=3346587 RepID=UPI00365CFDAA